MLTIHRMLFFLMCIAACSVSQIVQSAAQEEQPNATRTHRCTVENFNEAKDILENNEHSDITVIFSLRGHRKPYAYCRINKDAAPAYSLYIATHKIRQDLEALELAGRVSANLDGDWFRVDQEHCNILAGDFCHFPLHREMMIKHANRTWPQFNMLRNWVCNKKSEYQREQDQQRDMRTQALENTMAALGRTAAMQPLFALETLNSQTKVLEIRQQEVAQTLHGQQEGISAQQSELQGIHENVGQLKQKMDVLSQTAATTIEKAIRGTCQATEQELNNALEQHRTTIQGAMQQQMHMLQEQQENVDRTLRAQQQDMQAVSAAISQARQEIAALDHMLPNLIEHALHDKLQPMESMLQAQQNIIRQMAQQMQSMQTLLKKEETHNRLLKIRLARLESKVTLYKFSDFYYNRYQATGTAAFRLRRLAGF